MPAPLMTDRAALAVAVHERLCEAYGCPVDYFHDLDPVSELVSALLSHRTRNRQSGAAFHALRERFGDWETVRDADTSEVEATIPMVTWPEQKAPRIQQVLRDITERVGSLSLSNLDSMTDAEARAWLEQLPGVGPKTSAAVLSFSALRRRALPVDSHHHRVALRLGLLDEKVSVGPSHAKLEALLPADWDAQQVYDHHEVLMFHGQRVCSHRKPDCESCCLLDLCPTGQQRLHADEPTSGRTPPPKG